MRQRNHDMAVKIITKGKISADIFPFVNFSWYSERVKVIVQRGVLCGKRITGVDVTKTGPVNPAHY